MEVNENNNDSVIFKNHHDQAVEIILNKPNKLNAIDITMAKSIGSKVIQWLPTNVLEEQGISEGEDDSKPKPKIIIMYGIGDRSFCSGGDINALYQNIKKRKFEEIAEFYRLELLCDYYLIKIEPVFVSIWNGYVMGGGVGISINAPIRVATESTVFAMPEAAIGLYPDVGAGYFFPRIFNHSTAIGLYCGLTGHRIKGKDCAITGAATHYINRDKIEQVKKTLIQYSIDNDYCGVDNVRKIIEPYSEHIFSKETFSFKNENLIKKTFKLDSLGNIIERLEELTKTGEENEKQWAEINLESMKSACPVSLIIFFELVKRSIKFDSIQQTYELDRILFNNIAKKENLVEGIRAAIIDKDKKPKWSAKSLNEINYDEIVDKYFKEN